MSNDIQQLQAEAKAAEKVYRDAVRRLQIAQRNKRPEIYSIAELGKILQGLDENTLKARLALLARKQKEYAVQVLGLDGGEPQLVADIAKQRGISTNAIYDTLRAALYNLREAGL